MTGWTSAVPQQTGMWVQVEFPQALTISEVQFIAPGGGGGRGGAPAAAPAAAAGGSGRRTRGCATPATAAPTAAAAAGAPAPASPAPAAPPAAAQAPPGPPAAPAAAPPREFQVQVSMDGTKWSAPVARGQLSLFTAAAFVPVAGQVRARDRRQRCRRASGQLAIQNIRFYRPADRRPAVEYGGQGSGGSAIGTRDSGLGSGPPGPSSRVPDP